MAKSSVSFRLAAHGAALVTVLMLTLALPVDAGWDEGVAAFKRGNYEEAASEFQRLVKKRPNVFQGHYMLGQSLLKLDRNVEALSHLNKAYELEPDNLGVQLVLGKAYLDIERFEDAAEILAKIDSSGLPRSQREALQQMIRAATYGAGTEHVVRGSSGDQGPEESSSSPSSVVSDCNPSEKKGPFGLWMGMSKDDLRIDDEPKPHIFRLESVPKGHNAFTLYFAGITPENGLCEIRAVAVGIETSVYGVELTSKFREIEQQLTGVYGEHKKVDTLLHNSIWDEPRDWMMALIKGERFLRATWDEKEGSQLSNCVSTIILDAQADETDSGALRLDYRFDNWDSCQAEIEKLEADVF